MSRCSASFKSSRTGSLHQNCVAGTPSLIWRLENDLKLELATKRSSWQFRRKSTLLQVWAQTCCGWAAFTRSTKWAEMCLSEWTRSLCSFTWKNNVYDINLTHRNTSVIGYMTDRTCVREENWQERGPVKTRTHNENRCPPAWRRARHRVVQRLRRMPDGTLSTSGSMVLVLRSPSKVWKAPVSLHRGGLQPRTSHSFRHQVAISRLSVVCKMWAPRTNF